MEQIAAVPMAGRIYVVTIVGLAAQQACYPDLIRSPTRVLAHTWEGLLEWATQCPSSTG
jgi:hypothetical protein